MAVPMLRPGVLHSPVTAARRCLLPHGPVHLRLLWPIYLPVSLSGPPCPGDLSLYTRVPAPVRPCLATGPPPPKGMLVTTWASRRATLATPLRTRLTRPRAPPRRPAGTWLRLALAREEGMWMYLAP